MSSGEVFGNAITILTKAREMLEKVRLSHTHTYTSPTYKKFKKKNQGKMSARDYGVLMRSSAEMTRESTHKIHGDNILVLIKAVNFVGRSLQHAVLNKKFVTSFEGIFRKKGVELRVESVAKILKTANRTLLESVMTRCSKHSKDAESYHDIIHAVMIYFQTHQHLLDVRFLKEDTYVVFECEARECHL